MQQTFVAYLRVSTARQGRSGLGLEAQGQLVGQYIRSVTGQTLETFTEVESGRNCARPQLAAALAACRLRRATLLIAKIDRLSRDAAFLLGLQKDLQRWGLRFVAVDMPEANEMTIGIMAVVAQAERKMISERTKAALAAAKARGTKLGKPENLSNSIKGALASTEVRRALATQKAADLAPIIAAIRADGLTTLRDIASALNARGYRTARDKVWHPTSVRRVLEHLSV